jgi:predicted GIY-YIG superfamily endonuclease
MYLYVLFQQGIQAPRQGVQGSRDVYVGVAADVRVRLKAHNSGKVKATRGIQWRIVAYYQCHDYNTAFIFERWMKHGNSLKKRLDFVKHFEAEGINSVSIACMEEKAQQWANGRAMRNPLPVRWR